VEWVYYIFTDFEYYFALSIDKKGRLYAIWKNAEDDDGFFLSRPAVNYSDRRKGRLLFP